MPQHPYDLFDPITSDTPPSAGDSVAAVDIGGTNLRVAIADLKGEVLARWSASTVGMREPRQIVELIGEGVARCQAEASLPQGSLGAIGAGVPGITNSEQGLVIATSYLLGWRDVSFRHMLEDALDVPAAIENDVNLGAVGERWLGAARSVQDFVFLAIGTGVGAGIFLNGKLFQGSRWTAGEVGYMLVPGTSTEPVGSGQPGALESMVGGEGIRAQWHRVWDTGGVAAPRDLTATAIFDRALAGDVGADAILQQTARMLSYAIYNIWLIFNSPLFVLGGTVGLHPGLVAATRQQLQQLRGTASLQLAVSSLAADAQLAGAIRLALDTRHSIACKLGRIG